MLLRQLEYLTALASERHFGRAAALCDVTQPTLSAGIRQLEREFDVPLVKRGTRFEGFTPEGERVLRRAYMLLAERDAMAVDVGAMRNGLSGRLRVGAIPTALTTVGLLVAPFAADHPQVKLSVTSMSSTEIVSRLTDYVVDIGITYLDNDVLPAHLAAVPLYRERYVLLTRDPSFAARSTVSWSAAARLPLCLLSPDMQNRRIVDSLFERGSVHPDPILETNSISTIYACVREGGLSSVVAHAWLHLFGLPDGMYALPLVEPDETRQIGLVSMEREPQSVLGRALADVARRLDLQTAVDRVLQPWLPGRPADSRTDAGSEDGRPG